MPWKCGFFADFRALTGLWWGIQAAGMQVAIYTPLSDCFGVFIQWIGEMSRRLNGPAMAFAWPGFDGIHDVRWPWNGNRWVAYF